MSFRADAAQDVASVNADLGVDGVTYTPRGGGTPSTVDDVYVGNHAPELRGADAGGSFEGYDRTHRRNRYVLTAPLPGPDATWSEGDAVASDGGIVELAAGDTLAVPGRLVGKSAETVNVTVTGKVYRGQGHWSAEVAA